MTPWVRSAVDLVLERRKLARRVDVVDTVFGPDAHNAPTPAATWTPGRPECEWVCEFSGHLHAPGDEDPCVYCGEAA
jgi:hypothetical protein